MQPQILDWGIDMESANRLELEREWMDASKQADHWVDVIQDIENQIQLAGTLHTRLFNAKKEFRAANQKVIDLSNRLANL